MNQKQFTPVPNVLLDKEMPKMKDTELRLVMTIVRQTLGWQQNKVTKERKMRDWIAGSQLIKKTGKSRRAISKAIITCIQRGWIVCMDRSGNLLNTPNLRKGKKIYYQLGARFLKYDRAKEVICLTYAKSAQQPTQKVPTTKENYTKSSLAPPKDFKGEYHSAPSSFLKPTDPVGPGINILSSAEEVNHIIGIFKKELSPDLEYANKSEREAAEMLLDRYGFIDVCGMAKLAVVVHSEKYAPDIRAPYELKNKLPKLKDYIKRKNKN